MRARLASEFRFWAATRRVSVQPLKDRGASRNFPQGPARLNSGSADATASAHRPRAICVASRVPSLPSSSLTTIVTLLFPFILHLLHGISLCSPSTIRRIWRPHTAVPAAGSKDEGVFHRSPSISFMGFFSSLSNSSLLHPLQSLRFSATNGGKRRRG